MMGVLNRSPRRRVPFFTLLPVLAFALTSPAAGYDPPYRMEEATPDSNHVSLSGKGMWGYADAGGEYALIAEGGALAVIEVTDPTQPVLATRVPATGSDLKEVKTYKHYAFCVNQGGPLQIVDLSDPYHAYTAANYLSNRLHGAHNIWIEEDGYAYLALQGTGTQDLRILDLTQDPLRPIERGFYSHSQQGGLISAHDVYVRHDTCYASWFGGGLLILDVTNKDHPGLLVSINYPNPATHNAWPTLDGRYVCTTDEQPGGFLRIWDLQGRPIRQAADYATDTAAIIHNVHLKGHYAYIAYYTAGVRVVDLTDPRHPNEIGSFDTSRFAGGGFGGCWSVYPFAPSGLIYASDMREGLYVVRFLDARDAVIRGTVRVHAAEAARVEGVEVKFVEAGVQAVTDRAGYFQASLYAGTHTMRVSAPGFHTETFLSTVIPNQVLNHTIVLDPLPGAFGFVEEPGPPVELADGRLVFEARVRAGGTAVSEVHLRYRSGGTGGFRVLTMERVVDDDEYYRAFVPPQLPGTLVQYYIEARDGTDLAVFAPAEAPTLLLSHRVKEIDWKAVFTADFENDAAGFTVGSPDDDGKQGAWERAIPVPSPGDSMLYGGFPQPPADATPAGPGYCFLTELGEPGSPAYAHDVIGRTTLTSPVMTLTGSGDSAPAAAARLRLALWYVNDLEGSQWQDRFLIEASTDDGVSWRVIESMRISKRGWQNVILDLGSRLDLAGGELRVRFVAQDEISPTLIEAAVDDIRVEVTSGIKIQDRAGRPEVVFLRQNTPNPFNPATVITYQLKQSRAVRLAIYDATGHLVRLLTDGVEPVGDHAVTWDGRDVRGFDSPSGVYTYQLETQNFTESRKMLLLK